MFTFPIISFPFAALFQGGEIFLYLSLSVYDVYVAICCYSLAGRVLQKEREREKSVPDLKFRERSALSLCLSVSVSSLAYTRESQNVSNYDEKLCVAGPL